MRRGNAKRPLHILGISCYMHDAAACLLTDGRIVAFAEEERFRREKHTGAFPEQAIRYCLEAGGIPIERIDHIAFYWVPWRGVLHRIIHSFHDFPRNCYQSSHRLKIFRDMVGVTQVLRRRFGYRGAFHFVPHHHAHLASAFYPSGFPEAALLVLDANGEIATTTFARGEGTRIDVLRTVKYPHSLGILYLCVTEYLGFRESHGEGIVMGLAPYGVPRFLDDFREILRVTAEGELRLDISYFDVHLSKKRYVTEKFIRRFGPRRMPGGRIEPHHKDVAASLQVWTEEVGLSLVRVLHRLTGLSRLCMAGGVALNSVMNGRIVREGPFEEVYVQPAANDAGTALGAALYLHTVKLGRPRPPEPVSPPFWGPGFSEGEIERALRASGFPYERLPDLTEHVARHLAAGKIVAWFQGRMEAGPRALGNRSILADPRDPRMREVLNARIKKREAFRPFAPAILEAYLHDYFDAPTPSPYMLQVFPVRPEKRHLIPAVVHIDGTARVQSVNPRQNPRFHDLLSAFHRLTGIPVLLNTSFNRKGEPIVCTPEDALRAFEGSGIDLLAIGDFLVRQRSSADLDELRDQASHPSRSSSRRERGGTT